MIINNRKVIKYRKILLFTVPAVIFSLHMKRSDRKEPASKEHMAEKWVGVY